MSQKSPEHIIQKLYHNVSEVITQARSAVYKTANSEMVRAYWKIGKMIVQEEQNGKDRATYGKAVIKELSIKLQGFGASFSKRNLWYMIQFYTAFPKVNALRSELSWTHYRLILKVTSIEARTFYVEENNIL